MTRLLTVSPLIFAQLHNSRNQGWTTAHLYEHNGNLIAVLIERITPNGEFDDGPDDMYAYSLTNGIEQAFTNFALLIRDCLTLPDTACRLPDILIHYQPDRTYRYPDPLREPSYDRITLDWDNGRYIERTGVHPWSPMTKQDLENLIGEPVSAIPLR